LAVIKHTDRLSRHISMCSNGGDLTVPITSMSRWEGPTERQSLGALHKPQITCSTRCQEWSTWNLGFHFRPVSLGMDALALSTNSGQEESWLLPPISCSAGETWPFRPLALGRLPKDMQSSIPCVLRPAPSEFGIIPPCWATLSITNCAARVQ